MKKIVVCTAIAVTAALVGIGIFIGRPQDGEPSRFAEYLIHSDLKECGNSVQEVKCVVKGESGWLFLQESLLSLVHDWNDNSEQIIAFRDSLKAQGVELIVVPVPDKLLVESENYLPTQENLVPEEYRSWTEKLRKRGVFLVDDLDKFIEARDSISVFEPYESHCTEAGREILANDVAHKLKPFAGNVSRQKFTTRDTLVPGTGNLFRLKYGRYAKYRVREKKIVSGTGKNYRGSKRAPILIIGDSNAGEGMSRASDIGALIANKTGIETFSISKVGAANSGPQFFKGKRQFLKGRKAVVWVFDGREIYGKFRDPRF